jgi:hypothetical protein
MPFFAKRSVNDSLSTQRAENDAGSVSDEMIPIAVMIVLITFVTPTIFPASAASY